MPRVAIGDNQRMNLRVRPEQKAKLMRAAALKNKMLCARQTWLLRRRSASFCMSGTAFWF